MAAETLGTNVNGVQARGPADRCLSDEFWQVRLKAIRSLGKMKVARAVRPIGDCITHPQANLRKEAAAALGEIADPAGRSSSSLCSTIPIRTFARMRAGRCSGSRPARVPPAPDGGADPSSRPGLPAVRPGFDLSQQYGGHFRRSYPWSRRSADRGLDIPCDRTLRPYSRQARPSGYEAWARCMSARGAGTGDIRLPDSGAGEQEEIPSMESYLRCRAGINDRNHPFCGVGF